MDINTLIALAHQLLPADVWGKFVQAAGYLSIFGQIVPAFLTWGIPAATRAADWLARVVLASPLRPLVLWQAPAIVNFLDKFTEALEKVAETFKVRLEADLAEAGSPKPLAAPLTPPATPGEAAQPPK